MKYTSTTPTSLTKAFDNFESASRHVLAYLYKHLDFDLWMMTRVDGGDWIVLQTEDHGYDVPEGTVLKWADSFCSRMVQGLGPTIAPCSEGIPAYVEAPIGQQVSIGAYIGMPVRLKNGELFGTLCAIDPQPQSEDIVNEQPLIELLATMLSTVLDADLNLIEQSRHLEHIQRQAHTDCLTALLNRHGWNQAAELEMSRSKRYGSPMCVFIMDVDNLKPVNDEKGHSEGDKLLCEIASNLQHIVRENDIVARIGGDEFAILAVECNIGGGNSLLNRIQKALRAKNIEVSIGVAKVDPVLPFQDAVDQADTAMYEEKCRKRDTHNP